MIKAEMINQEGTIITLSAGKGISSKLFPMVSSLQLDSTRCNYIIC